MLDPIFNLLAGLLQWFYSLVPSYGFAIIALTTLVLLILSPLTYRSTKSMVSMRKVQPQVKRLQKKHKGDREKLNQEMMKLYQEHNVSPLSGCLPILIQSPVFIVMFRVIRGITRRSSDVGFHSARATGDLVTAQLSDASGVAFVTDSPARRLFNPEYLDADSALYQALRQDNEMNWLGIDLSRGPLEVLQNSPSEALPYIAMVVLVAALSWFQQRQIQGRMTGEVSSQQQMIMKIMPWMLPIFAVTMPGGLVLYFIVSAMLRIAQQAYITRSIYQNEELNAPIDFGEEDDDDDDDDDDEPENPLAALFGGGGAAKAKADATPSSRHGSRRPTSGATKTKNRSRPPRDSNGSESNGSSTKSSKKAASTGSRSSDAKGSKKSKSASASEPAEKVSGWGRAKRSASQKNEAPEKPVSRRVTPKGDSSSNRRGKK